MSNQNSKRSGKQSGGTLLGIIIGLIIGLGIAMAVAVAITKSSLPFLNKMGRPDKVPELTPGQISDPNKPLYGNREPAKEAAKDFAKSDAAPADDEKAATAKTEKSDKAEKSDKTLGDKPKTGDKAETKVTDAKPVDAKGEHKATDAKEAKAGPAKPDAGDEKWIYYLQAGAFREQPDAETTKAKLALSGFEATVSERSTENGLLYRVRIGPFNQVEAMNRARAKLSDNGMDVAVIRIAK